MNEKELKRFWSKVKKGPGCWEWTSSIDRNGRARFLIDYKNRHASRCIYFHLHPDANTSLCVCHTCDNGACVNPEHLWLGSHFENMKDMISKGRAFKLVSPIGENHPMAKLKEHQVRAIKNAKAGRGAVAVLARQFGITMMHVNNIRSGRIWKDVI